jgi:hypothetical protein
MARPVLGLAAAGAVAALAVGVFAGPALAAPDRATAGVLADASLATAALADSTATDGTDDTTGSKRHPDLLVLRLQRACDRIPNLLTRSAKLATRLAGDADTRGSIAWLQARVDKAEAAGNTDRVAALKARLKVREDLQKILPGRVERLKQAQSGICVDVAAAMAATS